MATQKFLTLQPSGDKIPLVGFGTARLPHFEAEEVVYNAIKTGYRLIDGAMLYGNEPEVGKAVRKAIAEGIVKREELFSKYIAIWYAQALSHQYLINV